VLCAVFTSSASAQYAFIQIARAGTGTNANFAEILGDSQGYYVSLNNSGVVAFRARMVGSSEGVFCGAGGPITTIATNGGTAFGFFGGFPSINDAGQVAFWAATPGLTDFVIHRGSGGATTLIASRVGEGFSTLFDGPSMNSAGTVAMRGGPPVGVYLGSGGSLTPLYKVGDGFVLDVASDPTFNDAGQIVFLGRNPSGIDGMFRGSGGALSTIATTESGSLFSGFPGGVGGMNSNGVVAFDAFLAAGGEGIFTSTGVGSPITIADSSGPFDDFRGSPSISGFGLAFTASLDAGGTVGIFTGGDPVTNKLIKVGDPLLGSTVAFIRNLGRSAMNDKGEIAFVAGLANDDVVVVRASFISSPPTLTITLTGTNTAIVAWPSPSLGWNLFQNTNLLVTPGWVPAPESVNDDGTNRFIIVNPPVGDRFYRTQL
jgi:hypothetical protein